MNNNQTYNTWNDVGVFPTPKNVVDDFTKFTVGSLTMVNERIKVLDLFAGDGRLGDSICKQLTKKRVKKITFLEVRKNAIPSSILNGITQVVLENGFEYKPTEKFDLVVSNPPYLAINARQAEEMGFTWKHARENGRNLFGLGIRKAIEMCAPYGTLSVIAPFAYLRGVNSAEFRKIIEEQCSEVIINASTDRTLFEGVNQDIAFQLFRKRGGGDHKKTMWRFAYNKSKEYKTIHVNLPFTEQTADKYVRVGPIVWNRKKELLSASAASNISVIYGGNITHSKQLHIPKPKYKNRQYIKRIGTIPTDLLTAPFIAVRRTLRGGPGSWKIDSVLVTDKSLVCTAENHVIVAELPEMKVKNLNEIQIRLEDMIKGYYFHSGSPNISTKVVSEIFSELITEYI